MSLDKQKIKTRIKDVLRADKDLVSFFRAFQVGAPAGNVPEGQVIPYIFVTNDEVLIEEMEDISTIVNNRQVTKKHTLHLLVCYMAKGATGAETEKILDDIDTTIAETLRSNYQLHDPEENNDPLAFSSVVEEIRPLNREMLGNAVQGRAMSFKVIAYT